VKDLRVSTNFNRYAIDLLIVRVSLQPSNATFFAQFIPSVLQIFTLSVSNTLYHCLLPFQRFLSLHWSFFHGVAEFSLTTSEKSLELKIMSLQAKCTKDTDLIPELNSYINKETSRDTSHMPSEGGTIMPLSLNKPTKKAS